MSGARLFILAGVFRQLDRAASSLPSAVFFLLTNLIYIGLAMAWGFSISHRILHRGVRRYLMLGCAMAVLWLFLRAVKYRFFEAGEINRYLWYLYYVPQVLAPLFSLFAALQMGRREDDAFSGWWHLMYLPAALLIGGVLTNNLHHQAFRPALGAETLEAAYIHGWVYYLAMAWSVALLLATGVMVYRKCRVCESRRLAWVPFLVFGGGFALCALSFANLYTLHKTPECLCLTFAAFWESCLQVGLVPTNGYYRYFFAESTAARADCGQSGADALSRAERARAHPAAASGSGARAVLLDADTRLQSAPIRGGRVYWVEDISGINRIRAQLSEVNAQLSEENELIQAENELKRQRAEIEEKNRLMDAMLRLVEPQLLQINRLLEDGTAQSLKHVCLLGAYVKRRVNLALICEKKETVPAEELTHCIRESLTYLTQYGVACALHQEGSGSVGSRDAQTAYDFFEDCLEAALPLLSAMMVRVECGARFSVRLMLEDAAGLPDESAYAQKGRLTIDDADGAPCATLSFDRGGDGG